MMLDPNHLQAMYLDPTVGSIVFQTAIGGLLALGATVRLYWGNLQRFWKRLTKSS